MKTTNSLVVQSQFKAFEGELKVLHTYTFIYIQNCIYIYIFNVSFKF